MLKLFIFIFFIDVVGLDFRSTNHHIYTLFKLDFVIPLGPSNAADQ